MQSKELALRAATKLWRQMVPRFGVTVGNATLRVSAYNLKPAEFLRWEYAWKAQLIKQILDIEQGDIVDIGANVGQTLVDAYASGANRRYFGFEPNPSAFWSLFTLVDDNKFNNCTILPVGLSDRTTVLMLYSAAGGAVTDSSAADAGASLVPDLRPARNLKSTPVPCYRFDDLRGDLGIDAIGLVKIDVEGGELSVLRGMEQCLRTSRPTVVCEILYADSNADLAKYGENVAAMMTFMAQVGYVVFRVRKSADDRHVLGAERVLEFPTQVWTETNSAECDYILMPTEKVPVYAGILKPVAST